jgi:hypothetical protein
MRLLNFLTFYLGWFACVAGAANGRLWLGPALVIALLALHLYLSGNLRLEVRLIVLIGLFGFAFDSLLAAAGLYAFEHIGAAPWLCPPWMVALWMLFATTLNTSMAWLDRSRVLAAVLGATGGAASYAAGARLGAIDLHANTLVSLTGIALAWAFAMPMLFWLRRALQNRELARRSIPCSSSR